MISEAEGAELVRLAREAVEKFVTSSIVVKPTKELAKFGVFVTIHEVKKSSEDLRGCIGFPLPYKGLHESVIEAAIAAATEDPRFPPVNEDELERIVLEVSVLSVPEELLCRPVDRRRFIVIGRDGLLLYWRKRSGLLLPQVPIELEWDIEEYLTNICHKAGVPSDTWLDPSSRLFTFKAAIFKEANPKGGVVRLDNNK